MCGICGMFNFDQLNNVNLQLIKKMCSTMIHRGPDGEGAYINENVGLGHRRLSVIDISGGNQPMCNEDQTIWIVQNGEIYNYVELSDILKKKGHKLRSNSDTEVIIHLYEEYGVDCLKFLYIKDKFIYVPCKNDADFIVFFLFDLLAQRKFHIHPG